MSRNRYISFYVCSIVAEKINFQFKSSSQYKKVKKRVKINQFDDVVISNEWNSEIWFDKIIFTHRNNFSTNRNSRLAVYYKIAHDDPNQT